MAYTPPTTQEILSKYDSTYGTVEERSISGVFQQGIDKIKQELKAYNVTGEKAAAYIVQYVTTTTANIVANSQQTALSLINAAYSLPKELEYKDTQTLSVAKSADADVALRGAQKDLANADAALRGAQKDLASSDAALRGAQKDLANAQKELTNSQKNLTDTQKLLTESQKELAVEQKTTVAETRTSDIKYKEAQTTTLKESLAQNTLIKVNSEVNNMIGSLTASGVVPPAKLFTMSMMAAEKAMQILKTDDINGQSDYVYLNIRLREGLVYKDGKPVNTVIRQYNLPENDRWSYEISFDEGIRYTGNNIGGATVYEEEASMPLARVYRGKRIMGTVFTTAELAALSESD